MNGKEIPFNKSDKYIEIIHKSTFLYPHSKFVQEENLSLLPTFKKRGRAHKKARWATDTDTTMDTTLLAKLLSAILLDTTLSVKLLDLPRPRWPSTTTWRG